MSLRIPNALLESFVAATMAEGRRICKDAAKILHKPEREVLQILKQLPTTTLNIYDDSDCTTSCPILLQKSGGGILFRCRKACILGTSRCIYHQTNREPPTLGDNIIRLTRLKVPDTETQYWCDESSRTVYNEDKEVVGELTADNELVLHTYDD